MLFDTLAVVSVPLQAPTHEHDDPMVAVSFYIGSSNDPTCPWHHLTEIGEEGLETLLESGILGVDSLGESVASTVGTLSQLLAVGDVSPERIWRSAVRRGVATTRPRFVVAALVGIVAPRDVIA